MNLVTELPSADGSWSKWSEWSVCTKGCGGGNRWRHRHCSQTVSKHGGNECIGKQIENATCNTYSCPSKYILFLKLFFISFE